MNNDNRFFSEFDLILDYFNDINHFTRKELNLCIYPDFAPVGKYEGISALTFDGLLINGEQTKCFSYIGFPDNTNEKVPAVILIHGGAGYPFLEWVLQWNKKGYAAIAISTEGIFPNRLNAGDVEGNLEKDWKELPPAPMFDDLEYSEYTSFDEMWMFHAVSRVLLAGKVLECFSAVDNTKIGAVGISWGAVVLSIAIGYKNNFSFAIPVYGSGYLSESLSFMRFKFLPSRNRELWLAENLFDNVDIPVLWLCMNDDSCFSANSNSKSYIHTVANNPRTTLSIKSGWIHGHSCCWDDIHYPCSEIYAFADAITKNCNFPKISVLKDEMEGSVTAFYDGDSLHRIQATLFYLCNEYEYSFPADIHKSHPTYKWDYIKLEYDVQNKSAKAFVPKKATYYYIEIKDLDTNISISTVILN